MATKARKQRSEGTLDDLQKCITHCVECYTLCSQTISYCLNKGDTHAAAAHMKLLMDCVEICQTSANFMIRGSAQHQLICAVCAEICERCADDCARLDADDAQMALCAEVCRRCTESCRQMAA